MQYDINELRTEMKAVKKKSRNIETRIPGQRKQLDEKLQDIEEVQKATSRTVSDLLIKVQEMTTEFQVLTGRFEEARYFSEKSSTELIDSRNQMIEQLKILEQEVADLKKKMSEQEATFVKALEESKKALQTKTEDTRKTRKKENLKDTKKTEVKDLYMTAYQAFKDGKTKEARKKFTSLLKDYKENEYSDNARFWIAESFYQDKNYEDAILAYEELFKNNPESNKMPGAMLKQGLAFYALKDKKTGKIILEKLIEKYPDSEQAKLAKRKIRKSSPPKKKK